MTQYKDLVFKTTIDGIYCRLVFWYQPEHKEYLVGFIAHKSRRVANDWIKGRKRGDRADNRITGNGGLTPLMWAIHTINEKGAKIPLPIIITGSDARRYRVYRKYLLKRGWIETVEYEGEKVFSYIHK